METTTTTTATTDAAGTQLAGEADILKALEGLSMDQLMSGESVNPEAGTHAPAPDNASSTPSKTDGSPDAKAGTQTQQEQPKPRDEKSDERAAKTWEEINREKAEIQRQREEIARANQDLLKRREELLPEAKKAMETADDYDRFAKDWAAEGRDDLAQRAKEKAAELRRTAQDAQTQAHAAKLQNAQMQVMREVVTENPELKDKGSELYRGVEELMRRKPILATYPDGIRDAVEVVRSRLEAKSAGDLRKEVADLKAKLAEREKLLQPGTGAPSAGASEGTTSFDNLSSAEREKRILASLRDADSRGEDPWR